MGAAALAQKAIKMYGVADLSSRYGRTKFFLYRIMWALGIPHNPRALLWRRWRGLGAIRCLLAKPRRGRFRGAAGR